ncbi:MAG: helix-turn-helix domain-containing protein [Clostridiales bacterium]|nr:helix-turn-helix domain-containing protein [Clostridiales bacterium]
MDMVLVPQDEPKPESLPCMVVYYVLDGALRIRMDGSDYRLSSGDFIGVPAWTSHSCEFGGDTVLMGYLFNPTELSRVCDMDRNTFSCNSLTETDGRKIQRFRSLLDQCAAFYFDRESDGRTELSMGSCYLQIMEFMVSHFMVPLEEGREDPEKSRVRSIRNFIQMNYTRQVSLTELAERFYMLPAYLSRYIKKVIGKSFLEYPLQVRLDAAVNAMAPTDKTMPRIALDNGFANVAIFNKTFRTAYGMTPSAWREQIESKKTDSREEAFTLEEKKLLNYLRGKGTSSQETDEVRQTLSVATHQFQMISRTWNRVISVGRAISLLNSEMQSHVLMLSERLGFQYIRIWELFGADLGLNLNSPDKKYNFGKLDSIIDFMVEHRLHPYLELRSKPTILLDSAGKYVVYDPQDDCFVSQSEKTDFMGAFLRHSVNRYGAQEVSSWYLELWCDPQILRSGGNAGEYFDVFDVTYRAVKAVLPDIQLGGCYDRVMVETSTGYGQTMAGQMNFEKWVKLWSGRNIQPDFISTYCFQIDLATIHDFKMAEGSGVPFSERHMVGYVTMCREAMRRNGMNMPLHISEWGLTVRNNNVINDSVYNGAFMLNTMMQLYNRQDALIYWVGSDLFTEWAFNTDLLSGGTGLLNSYGICKPSFYAVEFMNRLHEYLLGKSDNAIITMNGSGSYMIACHNVGQLSDRHLFMEEGTSMRTEEVPDLFEGQRKLRLILQISGMENGAYYIKTRRLNAAYGSIQDEWIRWGTMQDLSRADLEYLRNTAMPHITVSSHTVADGQIHFGTQ